MSDQIHEEVAARRESDTPPVSGWCDPRFEQVRDAFISNFGVHAVEPEVGAAVTLYHRGELVVDLWGGYADAARTRAWERDTIVLMMSVAKGIAAMCVHVLVDRGLVDLDAPVATYWPEFAAAGKAELPVRFLLDHRAGLPVVDGLYRGAIYDQAAMASALAAQAPVWTPGESSGYHVMTYGYLLNELVLRVTGRDLGQFLREELAGPLGADYMIGLRDDELERCAEFFAAETGTVLNVAEMEPGSLLARVYDQHPDDWSLNDVAWRRSCIPSATGHGTARGVARLYAAFAGDGEIDGVRVISRSGVEAAVAQQHHLPEVVMGRRYHQASGFVLNSPPIVTFGSDRAFGHHGVGGSIGMGDLGERLGFCYAPNRMHARHDNGPRARGLLRAVYSSLGRQDVVAAFDAYGDA